MVLHQMKCTVTLSKLLDLPLFYYRWKHLGLVHNSQTYNKGLAFCNSWRILTYSISSRKQKLRLNLSMTALLLHSLSGGIQKSPKIPPKNVFEGKVSDQILNKRATQVHLLS